MSFEFHHPNHYKKIKSVQKRIKEEKTRTYSWSEPLNNYDAKSFGNNWENIADHVRGMITADLDTPGELNTYAGIDIDAGDGLLFVRVRGVKPRLWNYFEKERALKQEEEDD